MLLAVPLPVSALDLGEWVPGLTVSPFVSERVEYQTNVFQVPTGAQDDFISRTVPGFLIDYTAGPFTASAGYRLEILRFMDLEGQDNEHHIALGQLKYEGPRIMALIRDDFVRTSDPPGSEITGRLESTTNTLAPEVEFKITPRLAVGTNYTWTHINFDRAAEQLDRDEHLIGGSVFWKILPKADLRLNYNYGQKDFDASGRDVTRHLILFGVRGDLTARLSSTFRVGYERREQDTGNRPNFSGFSMGGDWTYRPLERTRITLLTDRTPQESVFGNTLFYVSTTAAVLLDHQFTSKLSGNARINAGMNDYPEKSADVAGRFRFRDDTLWGWGGGLDYEIQRWLRVGAEYAHTRRNSNFDEFDYKDDKITAKVTLQF